MFLKTVIKSIIILNLFNTNVKNSGLITILNNFIEYVIKKPAFDQNYLGLLLD